MAFGKQLYRQYSADHFSSVLSSLPRLMSRNTEAWGIYLLFKIKRHNDNKTQTARVVTESNRQGPNSTF